MKLLRKELLACRWEHYHTGGLGVFVTPKSTALGLQNPEVMISAQVLMITSETFILPSRESVSEC
jgi:hypothetical protein